MSTSVMTAGEMIGKVQISRILGEGAAGIVYQGFHTTLGIDVAVKVLKAMPTAKDNEVYQQRFQREAQLAARLQHPALVRVLDFGDHNGRPFLVMDFVDGFSLADYLKRRTGPIDEKTVLKVLLAAAGGLAEAHRTGIIHRDLKPSNILISRQGQLKIADMGLARQEGMAHLTMDQVVVGTPAYIAPECLSPGGRADPRSDLYALGVIGYRMAFGKKPYSGTVQEIVLGHIAGNAEFNDKTECSAATVALIQRLMANDPEGRCASAAEVCRHIREDIAPRLALISSTVGVNGTSANDEPSSSNTLSRVSDFRGIVSFFERRLGESSSRRDGGTIVHTTTRERYLVWAMLLGVFLAVGVGYMLSG